MDALGIMMMVTCKRLQRSMMQLWMIVADKWTRLFPRHLPKTKEKETLGIGLWDRHPVRSLFSSRFDDWSLI